MREEMREEKRSKKKTAAIIINAIEPMLSTLLLFLGINNNHGDP